MKIIVGILFVSAAIAASPTLAQQPRANETTAVATTPGKGAVVDVVTVAATVTAIDKEKRAITLKGPQGNPVRVVAGPEVRNFDQIKVGDEVVVRHLEAVSLELKKGGAGIRERVESDDAARAAAGQKPGAVAVHRVTIVADVVAVNARTQTVTLRGPEHTVDLRLRDPKQFKMVKVGDQVQATFTDAIALSVEPAPSKR
jgi:hypothetical protein